MAPRAIDLEDAKGLRPWAAGHHHSPHSSLRYP